MKKGFKIAAISLNIALFVMVVAVFIYRINLPAAEVQPFNSVGFAVLKFFTTESNLLLGITCGIYAVFGLIAFIKKEEIPYWVGIIKTVSTASTTLTALIVLIFLEPQWISYGGNFFDLYTKANFFFHFIVPVLGIFGYIFLESEDVPKLRATLFSMIPPGIYGIGYLLNVIINGPGENHENDFYGFASWGIPIGLLLYLAVIAVTYCIGLGLWFARKAIHLQLYAEKHQQSADVEYVNYREPDKKVIVSEEIIDDVALRKVDDDEEFKADTSSEVVEEGGNEEVELVTKSYKTETGTIHSVKKKVTRKVVEEDTSKQLHISQHLLGWQLKQDGEEKPIKLFRSQKEAVEYAKKIVKQHGGIIFVHTTDTKKK